MKIIEPGDTGTAICVCSSSVATTMFERRTVAFSDGRGEAQDVLVGVCLHCGSVVSLPAQSTTDVKAARDAAT